MGEEKGFLDRIGEAMDEARAKASEVGGSLVKKAGVAATDAKRSVGKATTAVGKQAAKAKRAAGSTAKSAAKSASRAMDTAK